MDENMLNDLDVHTEDKVSSPVPCKTWEYTEKVNLHSIHHTISVNEDKLTHITEIHEAGQAMKKRRDIKLSNVRAVHTYYGFSRNALAFILCVVLSIVCFIGAICVFAESGSGSDYSPQPGNNYNNYNDYYGYDKYYGDGLNSSSNKGTENDSEAGTIILGIVFVAAAVGFIFLGYLAFKAKPSFVLEIEMYISENKKIEKNFAYGDADIKLGGNGLFRSIAGNKYRLLMDPKTGNDIVDTLGAYLISE